MKEQTTIEFILILSAVAAVAVFSIGELYHLQSAQRTVYDALLNNTNNTIQPPTYQIGGVPSLYANIANTTYVNSSNEGYLVAYVPEGYNLSSITILGNGFSFIGGKDTVTSSYGLYTAHFFAIPRSSGNLSFSVSAIFKSLNGVYERNETVYTYAVPVQSQQFFVSGTNSTPYLTPYIYRHNETLVYNISNFGQVYTVGITNKCSRENWEYQQEDIGAQCGNAQWYFWIYSDDCYYEHGILTATYCVYMNVAPIPLGNLGTTTPKYAYNITLQLYNKSLPLSLAANLTNRSPYGNLQEGTTNYGNVVVNNSITAISPLQYENTVLMEINGQIKTVNSTVYQSYLQALNNLYAVLGYYNGTGIDDGDMATIQQTINSYNLEEGKLVNSSEQPSHNGCWFGANSTYEYMCKPIGLFDYGNITAHIGKIKVQTGPESLSGSIVNLVNG
jgi:hypothetical protein